MKKKLLVTALAVSAGVSGARANPGTVQPTPIGGSDTLFNITNDVVSNCPSYGVSGVSTALSGSLKYIGGGSSFGGGRMNPATWAPNGQQQVAPQSRFLSSAECGQFGTNAGQGVMFALDGIGVFHDSTENSACNVLRYKGCITVQDLNDKATLGFGLGAAGVDDGTGTAVADEDAATPGTQYCFNHWSEALRIIYAGQHAHNTTAACTTIPTAAAVAGRRCNSDVRRTLVENWSNIFDQTGGGGDGGCADGNCTRLKHAYRRDDLSGTTDTFLTLIGVAGVTTGTPPAPQKTFCNGIENEDLDPIRRDCSVNAAQPTSATLDTDSVCSSIPMRLRNLPFDAATGNPTGAFLGPTSPNQVTAPTGAATTAFSDLGLVLAVSPIPDRVNRFVLDAQGNWSDTGTVLNDPATGQPYNPQFDTTACSAAQLGGTFRLSEMAFSAGTTTQRCPSGAPRAANKCQWITRVGAPSADGSTAAGWFNCKATRRNRLVGAAAPWADYDARAYNWVPRHPQTGALLVADNTNGTGGIKDARFTGGGTARIHMILPATALANHPTCKFSDATRQIGCLTKADPCSIGYAGLEAQDSNTTPDDLASPGTNAPLFLATPNGLAEVQPTIDRIQDLVDACNSGLEGRYPIARTLWLNSARGLIAAADLPTNPANSAGQTFALVNNSVDSDPGNDTFGFETVPNTDSNAAEPDGTLDLLTRENDLARCFASVPNATVQTHGFITLPAGAHRLFQCNGSNPPLAVGNW